MFSIPSTARHALAQLVTDAIQKNTQTLTFFDIQGFSMQEGELSEEELQDVMGILEALKEIQRLDHLNVSGNEEWECHDCISETLDQIRKGNKKMDFYDFK